MAKSKCADAKGIQTACPAVRVKTACHKTTRDFPKHPKQFLKRSESLCWQTCQLNRTESPNRDSSNQDGTLIFQNNEIRVIDTQDRIISVGRNVKLEDKHGEHIQSR